MIVKEQKAVVRIRSHFKNPTNSTLWVKGQRRVGIMNVRNISSLDDSPMCQIWFANITAKITNMPETDLPRQTYRWTNFVRGGINRSGGFVEYIQNATMA